MVKRIMFSGILCFLISSLYANTIVVNNSDEFKQALENATAGTVIALSDGIYNKLNTEGAPLIINASGTVDEPVVIKANSEKPQVIITGKSALLFKGDYIHLQDIYFKEMDAVLNPGGKTENILKFKGDYNKLINCVIDGRYMREGFLIEFSGVGNEIAYNTFYDSKRGCQLFLNVYHFDFTEPKPSVEAALSTYDSYQPAFGLPVGGNWVHHNYFYNPKTNALGQTKEGNGQSAIRTGSGEICYAYTLIEHNLFDNCNAEGEIITLKGKHSLVRYNTFNNSARLTFRHTTHSRAYANYFIGGADNPSCGISIWGKRNEIVNNYFENVDKAITFVAGYDSSHFASAWKQVHVTHRRCDSILIANNSFINSQGAVFYFGRRYLAEENRYKTATNVRIINNLATYPDNDQYPFLFINSTEQLVIDGVSEFSGNMVYEFPLYKQLNATAKYPNKLVKLQWSAKKINDVDYLVCKQKPMQVERFNNLTEVHGKGGNKDTAWDNQDLTFSFDIFGCNRNETTISCGAMNYPLPETGTNHLSKKYLVEDIGISIGSKIPVNK